MVQLKLFGVEQVRYSTLLSGYWFVNFAFYQRFLFFEDTFITLN